MKSRALLSISVFFLCMFWFEYQLSLIPNSYNWKCKRLFEECSKIKCLVLGSSHSYYGINPNKFSLKTFNLANASQSLALDTAIVKHFANRLPQLDVIIIPISYFSMEYRLLDCPESWRDCYASHFLGVSEAPWWQVFTSPKYLSLTYLYGPMKVQEILNHRFNISYAQDIDINGWFFGKDKSPITKEAGLARVKAHEENMKAKNFQKNLACLTEVLSVCDKRNIKVVFVSTPVHKYYFQNMNMNKWSKSQKNIRALCNLHQSIYLDYLQNKDFTDTDFRDTDHLTTQGASHFTQLLNEQLTNYLSCTYRKG